MTSRGLPCRKQREVVQEVHVQHPPGAQGNDERGYELLRCSYHHQTVPFGTAGLAGRQYWTEAGFDACIIPRWAIRSRHELLNNAERGGAKEGDIEEADEEYSARVQRMRKIHMAREKKKNQRRSILPYGEDDVNTGEESPPARPSHPFHSSDSSYNFDDFLLPTSKRDEDEEPNRLSRGRGVSSTNQSDSIPPSVLRRQSTAARQSESSLKLRSLSIPNQLEQVEWSIAHQEALIRSIAEQRIKMIHSPEDDTVAKLQQVQFGKTTW
ncbi:hypothetical protein GN958_ATG05317 [Phytophthora infestans]|uniref:Uncharacterized protein n=1 Tax=Phytophthora infestans TaxID=4787 RepID=A0A8S9V205_PHYIN|nr:hypothetical protein GN958_ATG05317 [Phytophthora infestans]